MTETTQSRYDFIIGILGDLERIATRYFRRNMEVNNKAGFADYDPVTIADKEIEQYFRTELANHFPDDRVVGEEFENRQSDSRFVWTIDPIDGTRAFVAGSPTFTILICLDIDGHSEIGIVSQPFTGERFISHGKMSKWHHKNEEIDISVSKTTLLKNTIMASTFPEIGSVDERQAFERVEQHVKLTRYGMDGYAYGLLAAGHIDLVIEAGLKPFDYAAPRAVVLTAGGVFCGWDGGEIDQTGRVIAAATSELADAAIALLQEN